jgi:hypothetical protein
MDGNRMARAFDLGGRDAYILFHGWCDDLERRMMADWIAETREDSVAWLEVRDAAAQGWQQRQQAIADARIDNIEAPDEERELLHLRARAFGGDLRYQRFPYWSDDLEYKLQSDWKRAFGGVSWFEVREAVKRGWEERRGQAAAAR